MNCGKNVPTKLTTRPKKVIIPRVKADNLLLYKISIPIGNIPFKEYANDVESKIILTNGFVKKTQKTPENEKKLAKKYKADHERRHPNE